MIDNNPLTKSGGTGVAEPPPPETDVTRLASGAGVALGGKMIGRGVRLLVDITLARLLGPVSFGLYAIGWTITRIVTLVTPLGLDTGAIRFGSKYWQKDPARLKGVISQSLWFSVASGLVAGALLFIAAPWLGEGVFHSSRETAVIRCFALAFPLVTGLRIAAATTRISQRMKFAVFAEDMSQPMFDLALILILFSFGVRLAGALAACVFSFGLSLVLALKYIKRLFPEVFSPEVRPVFQSKELWTFSLASSLVGIFGVLLIWVDRLFVGYFRSPAEVGIYQAASQLTIGFAIVRAGFTAIFSPMAADLAHRGELIRLEELFRVTTKWGLYLSIPFFLVMCFVPHEVMRVLFGSAYSAGWKVLVVLGVAQVINAGSGPVGLLLVMTGHQNRMFAISGTTFFFSLILDFALIPRWGMFGAAIAAGLSISGLFISAVLMARHILGMVPYDRRYIKGFFAATLSAGALFLLRELAIASPLLRLFSAIAVSVSIFVFALRLFGLDKEDTEFIGKILARVK